MGLYVTFTLEIEVTDAKAFRDAAIEHHMADNASASYSELRDFFGTKTNPNVQGCARELFDPGVSPAGCEIQDSSAEEYTMP